MKGKVVMGRVGKETGRAPFFPSSLSALCSLTLAFFKIKNNNFFFYFLPFFPLLLLGKKL